MSLYRADQNGPLKTKIHVLFNQWFLKWDDHLENSLCPYSRSVSKRSYLQTLHQALFQDVRRTQEDGLLSRQVSASMYLSGKAGPSQREMYRAAHVPGRA